MDIVEKDFEREVYFGNGRDYRTIVVKATFEVSKGCKGDAYAPPEAPCAEVVKLEAWLDGTPIDAYVPEDLLEVWIEQVEEETEWV